MFAAVAPATVFTPADETLAVHVRVPQSAWPHAHADPVEALRIDVGAVGAPIAQIVLAAAHPLRLTATPAWRGREMPDRGSALRPVQAADVHDRIERSVEHAREVTLVARDRREEEEVGIAIMGTVGDGGEELAPCRDRRTGNGGGTLARSHPRGQSGDGDEDSGAPRSSDAVVIGPPPPTVVEIGCWARRGTDRRPLPARGGALSSMLPATTLAAVTALTGVTGWNTPNGLADNTLHRGNGAVTAAR